MVNKELTGLTRLPLFHDVTGLWPLEFCSSKDVFERVTIPVGDERWFSVYFSQQIDWFSIVQHLYKVRPNAGLLTSELWPSIFSAEDFIFSVELYIENHLSSPTGKVTLSKTSLLKQNSKGHRLVASRNSGSRVEPVNSLLTKLVRKIYRQFVL